MLKRVMAIAFCAVSAFAMHNAELNINDKDLEVSAKVDMGQLNNSVEPDTIFVGGKFYNCDKKHSGHENANIDPFYELNFLMIKEVNDALKVGMGAKLNFTKNFSSLPLGLQAEYKLPQRDLVPMYLDGEIYYAPSALSFSDADSFVEYRVSYDIEIIENGRITLGYRHIDTDYKSDHGGDFKYNSSWYIGFKIAF